MKKPLKNFIVLVVSIAVYLFHLPLSLAKSTVIGGPAHPGRPGPLFPDSSRIIESGKSLYDSLQLDISGLSRQAFEYGKKGLEILVRQGRVLNDSILSIIDFSQSSNKKRLYVLDIKNFKVLFNTLVAHGKNSGLEWANSFSNKEYSFKSSPGFYITGDTYNGNNGYSLKLDGIEKGINDNAYQRAIVLHGASYVNETIAAIRGYVGRSEGCPAVPLAVTAPLINRVKDHTCLFIYPSDANYISHSTLLQ